MNTAREFYDYICLHLTGEEDTPEIHVGNVCIRIYSGSTRERLRFSVHMDQYDQQDDISFYAMFREGTFQGFDVRPHVSRETDCRHVDWLCQESWDELVKQCGQTCGQDPKVRMAADVLKGVSQGKGEAM